MSNEYIFKAVVFVVAAAVAVAVVVVLPNPIPHSAVMADGFYYFCFCCDLSMTGCWLRDQ